MVEPLEIKARRKRYKDRKDDDDDDDNDDQDHSNHDGGGVVGFDDDVDLEQDELEGMSLVEANGKTAADGAGRRSRNSSSSVRRRCGSMGRWQLFLMMGILVVVLGFVSLKPSSSSQSSASSPSSSSPWLGGLGGGASNATTTTTNNNNNEKNDDKQQSCTDQYTNETGWLEWLETQTQRPSSDWCNPVHRSMCRCHHNPLEALPKQDVGIQLQQRWDHALERNQQLVAAEQTRLKSPLEQPLDLVLLGDSLVEHWLGTDLGDANEQYQEQFQTYQTLFRNKDSAYVQGLALGISGDRCNQVLYRLQLSDGELPQNDHHRFRPALWWIVVGTHDLFDRCAADLIAAGIINIAEYIHAQYPNLHVVIHSILPRGNQVLDPTTNLDWADIVQINQKLACYAANANTENQTTTSFFNATDLFVTPNSPTMLDTSLFLEDSTHPNGRGSQKWGQAIVRESLTLLGKPQPPPDAFPTIESSPSLSPPPPAADDEVAEEEQVSQQEQSPPPEDTSSAADGPEQPQQSAPNDESSTQVTADNDNGAAAPATVATVTPKEVLQYCYGSHGLTTSQAWTEWIASQTAEPNADDLCQSDTCGCMTIFTPQPQENDNQWEVARQRNIALFTQEAEQIASGTTRRPLDLVMTGDSIVEHLLATGKGEYKPQFDSVKDVYEQLFRRDNSFLRGLALGIGGDRVHNVLYRLQNGEMPTTTETTPIFHDPFVWWILIGTYDLPHGCSPRGIAGGIINLVQLIQRTYPNVRVVVQAILPRKKAPLDKNPLWQPTLHVNQMLQCYAATTALPASTQPPVTFYDATDLFVTNDQTAINNTMMGDFFHPSPLGYAKLGEAMIRTSLDLLGRPPVGPDAFDDIEIP